MSTEERKELARKRWKLLIEVLLGRRAHLDDTDSCSVRRFSSFGLLSTDYVRNDGGNTWFRYSSIACEDYSPLVRHLDSSFQIDDVLGFNNTGNVCVWPAEEVLTHYALKHPEIFSDKSVCEIGGGMTCLSGLAVAMCTNAKYVLFTDGNDKSMLNAKVIIDENLTSFKDTKVSSRVLLWNEYTNHNDLKESFDVVIAADCLFFDDYRQDLVDCLNYIIKPGGIVLSFAPTRGKTLQQFVQLAKRYFDIKATENYDNDVWSLHEQNLKKGLSAYDPNLHFPVLLELTKR